MAVTTTDKTIAAAMLAETVEAYGTGTMVGMKIRSDEGDYRYSVPADQALTSVAHHIADGHSIEVWYYTPDPRD